MSMQINHEEVAKSLAFKIADLEYQVAAYKNLVQQLEQKVQELDAQIPKDVEVDSNVE